MLTCAFAFQVGLGGLAFTPSTPEVLRFAAYMSSSHQFFDDVFLGVYNDEVRWGVVANGVGWGTGEGVGGRWGGGATGEGHRGISGEGEEEQEG